MSNVLILQLIVEELFYLTTRNHSSLGSFRLTAGVEAIADIQICRGKL
jgi:hypothetical protein